MIVHNEPVAHAGVPLETAEKALIMLHDKGERAEGFIKLSEKLMVSGERFAILAVQGIQNAWFPNGFMDPIVDNMPQLEVSLDGMGEVVHNLADFDILPVDIYFMGKSQGAALVLEFILRRGGKWGGLVCLDGGLIGKEPNLSQYKDDLDGTVVFLGNEENKLKVPKDRIDLTETTLKNNGAEVTVKIYPEGGEDMQKDAVMMADLVLNNKL